MTTWPARVLVNTAYAFLAEGADAADRAEMVLLSAVDDKARGDLCRNRAELDASLAAPTGHQATAEKALLREIGAA